MRIKEQQEKIDVLDTIHKESSIEDLDEFPELDKDTIGKTTEKKSPQILSEEDNAVYKRSSVTSTDGNKPRGTQKLPHHVSAQQTETIDGLETKVEQLTELNINVTQKYELNQKQLEDLKEKMETNESQFVTTIQSLNRSLNELETTYHNTKDDLEEENDMLIDKIKKLEEELRLAKINDQ